MKKTSFALILSSALLASQAFADVQNKVDSVREISFDPQTSVLSGAYMTGGGCQTHAAKAELSLKKVGTDYPTYEVQISLLDVSPAPDFCEALVYPEFKIDLKSEIKALIKSQNIADAYRVTVKLPALAVDLD